VFQQNKFSDENIEYYFQFLFFIQEIDLIKVLYLDESHFDSRQAKIRFGRSRGGERSVVTNNAKIDETLSLTLICSLNSSAPYFFTTREDSNTQLDFLQFILDVLENGILKPGSTLIYDNASVHSGQESIFMLNELLQAYDNSFCIKGLSIIFFNCLNGYFGLNQSNEL
jgi:hypothetical protein